MYRLIFVEDEAFVRKSVIEMFDWEALRIGVAASFEDGGDAMEYLRHNGADIVITDVRMFEVSGLDLARYVAAHCPQTRVVIISGYSDYSYMKSALQSRVCDYLLKPVDLEELRNVLARIVEELDAREASDGARREPPASDPEDEDKQSTVIRQSMAYIEGHLSGHLTVEEVAASVFLSASYFSREFRRVTGMTVIDYIVKCKMDYAISLLLERKLDVREIAEKAGYNDVKYFHRAFKRYTDTSVREYQRLHARNDIS